MARDAMGKLMEASTLNKEADKLRKRDPAAAVSLDGLASRKRRSAIRQMSRRPKRKRKDRVTISG